MPDLYESNWWVMYDTLYIKKLQRLYVFLLNDEPGVSKYINFILYTVITNSIFIAPTGDTLYQKQDTKTKNFTLDYHIIFITCNT